MDRRRLETVREALKELRKTEAILCMDIQEWINELPKSEQRIIFDKRYIEGYTFEEIARFLGCSESAVRKIHGKTIKQHQ